MSQGRRKTFYWMALSAGLGGSLLFGVLCILWGPPRRHEWYIYVWPITTVVLLALSALMLRRAYRFEPANFSGFWHLSIMDFYAVILFAAISMGIARAAYPLDFNPAGFVVSILLASAFLFCLLLAARKGCVNTGFKVAGGLGFFLFGLGSFSLGALLVFVVFATLTGGSHEVLGFIGAILGIESRGYPRADIVILALRAGLVSLPIGVLILRWMARRLMETTGVQNSELK